MSVNAVGISSSDTYHAMWWDSLGNSHQDSSKILTVYLDFP
jgi:hypothetical protein